LRARNAEALGVWDKRKARRRCMFLITAARRAASSFIASASPASRRSIRDAVLSFGSLFIDSGCFASSMISRRVRDTIPQYISIQSRDCEFFLTRATGCARIRGVMHDAEPIPTFDEVRPLPASLTNGVLRHRPRRIRSARLAQEAEGAAFVW
jgi:hypothetical protein